MKRVAPTSIYLLPALKAKLAKAAKADRRSLSSLVAMIAEDWLDQEAAKRKNTRA